MAVIKNVRPCAGSVNANKIFVFQWRLWHKMPLAFPEHFLCGVKKKQND